MFQLFELSGSFKSINPVYPWQQPLLSHYRQFPWLQRLVRRPAPEAPPRGCFVFNIFRLTNWNNWISTEVPVRSPDVSKSASIAARIVEGTYLEQGEHYTICTLPAAKLCPCLTMVGAVCPLSCAATEPLNILMLGL